ncbi:MAG: Wzt carbohydrate-binding domain-containing protein, partial [Oscillospiraceae bacterium]
GKIIYDGDVEEAIRVYSDESFKFNLCQSFPQPDIYPSYQLAAIKEIEVLNTDTLIFSAQKKLTLKITCNALDHLKDEVFRCVVKYAGANIIGTYLSVPFEMEQNPDVGVEITFDLSTITPGKYFCDLAVGNVNSARFILHDEIESAFGFEISENDNQMGIRWSSGRWGYNVFAPLEVKVEE